jgi:membrane-associated protease RseP (regulator of RpoE activity)
MSESIPPLSDPIGTSEILEPTRPVVWVVHRPKQRYWLHALLLILTICTTLIVGARMQFNFDHDQDVFTLDDNSLDFFPLSWAFAKPSNLLKGVPFSLTLMTILMAHEMGHYLMCRYYRVSATLPFFIPFPTLIGTMGAFIRIRSPIRSRVALFDIGVAGPIAGFVVALSVLPFALGMSHVAQATSMKADRIQLGYPLIFQLIHQLIVGIVPSHSIAAKALSAVSLHPVAIAAWVGMFATALNLLPGGQLDGGHIIFSIAPRAHRYISMATIAAMIPAAYYLWVGWLVWAVLLGISAMRHPQVEEEPRITGHRRWVAAFALAMLVLTFTPAPFANSSFQHVVGEFRSTRR